uniref:Uncharacterized protein n=1 Tax=Knipowitschia caucasica TaxID=637954 RepID=A0AAV2JG44_KNICA
MTAYLSKQQSCFSELDGQEDREGPSSYSWLSQQPGTLHHHYQHQHQQQQQHHHHNQQSGQRYHYASVPGGATLPRRGGRPGGWHHSDSLSHRSPSHFASVRAKGGSCDLWPSECGCHHNWHEPYQVKQELC